jgi:hypothetical protein
MLAKAIEEVRGDMVADSRAKNRYGRRIGFAALIAILVIMAMAFGGWTYRKDISKLFLKEEQAPIVKKTIQIPRKPVQPLKKAAALFLDEQKSLAGLFRLFNESGSSGSIFAGHEHLELVSLTIGPEYHVMFKKPFLMQLSSSASTSSLASPRYLLVRELTDEGALVIDADGREHPVGRDFLIRNWGSKISWFFPCKSKDIHLKKGMNTEDVMEVQRVLHDTGYPVETTGIFNESTFDELLKFQKDFGLVADGIAGPQTMAVLYLMK